MFNHSGRPKVHVDASVLWIIVATLTFWAVAGVVRGDGSVDGCRKCALRADGGALDALGARGALSVDSLQFALDAIVAAAELEPGHLDDRGRRDPDRGSLRVEVAIPRGIERHVLDDWIRQGIGAHLAFGVSSPARFGELGELVEAQGFRSPASLQASASRRFSKSSRTTTGDQTPPPVVPIQNSSGRCADPFTATERPPR